MTLLAMMSINSSTITAAIMMVARILVKDSEADEELPNQKYLRNRAQGGTTWSMRSVMIHACCGRASSKSPRSPEG